MGFSYNPGNAGASPPVTASNGLTETSGNIELGGQLENVTLIDLNSNPLVFEDSATNTGFGIEPGIISVSAEDSVSVISVGSTFVQTVQTTGTGAVLMQVQNASTSATKSLELDQNQAVFLDQINESGEGYAADYSVNGITQYGDRWKPDVGYVNSLLGSTANGSVINGSASQTLFSYNQTGANALFELGGKLDQLSGIGSVVFNCDYTDWTGTTQTISFASTETIMVQGASNITVSIVVTGMATYDAAAYIKFLF